MTQAYLAYHEEKRAAIQRPPEGAAAAAAGGYYRVQSFDLLPADTLAAGALLAVRGVVESPDARAPVVLIGIVRADGTPVYGVATDMDGVVPRPLAADRFAFELEFPGLPLLPGKYFIRAHVLDPEGVRMFDTLEKPLVVTGANRELGLVRLAHRWRDCDSPVTHSDAVVAAPRND